MSEGLDFSDLTDDQIVDLAAALAREALLRSPAMVAAFEAALVDEKQRAEAVAGALRQSGAKLFVFSNDVRTHDVERLGNAQQLLGHIAGLLK